MPAQSFFTRGEPRAQGASTLRVPQECGGRAPPLMRSSASGMGRRVLSIRCADSEPIGPISGQWPWVIMRVEGRRTFGGAAPRRIHQAWGRGLRSSQITVTVPRLGPIQAAYSARLPSALDRMPQPVTTTTAPPSQRSAVLADGPRPPGPSHALRRDARLERALVCEALRRYSALTDPRVHGLIRDALMDANDDIPVVLSIWWAANTNYPELPLSEW